ncbi:MAG: ferrous iron transport protein B [Armatimonadota bacterium]|nr:ferrous iron transport protein B [Armatimonadota bacterium]MDR7427370.1 ferrous iron transport protein B [Armatimonadota bacterium]MDR7465150.1 ferrous iron transport protein B [Armatimonadota bacterium]MDR7470083.1 ferrous iron transport protein B [Armatimonadota bacterium]MDR7474395.1 ferrous iron transport protein B [Armatimonadota bacterium]
MSAVACHQLAPYDQRAGTTVALAGNPNVGKSTIFNRLTGLEVLTTNYPGATVEVNAATVRLDGQVVTLVDLPGLYCLTCTSGDQCAARQALLEWPPDAVVAIVDATNLMRNLYLVLQLIDLGFPVVVALNLADVAERAGIRIDVQQLRELLGVPVIPTVAVRGWGLREVLAEALRAAGQAPAVRHRYSPLLEREVARLASSLDGHIPLSRRGTALLLLEGALQPENLPGLAPQARAPLAERTASAAARLEAASGEPASVAVARERHALAERLAARVTVSPGEFRGRAAWRAAIRPATGVPLLLAVLAVVFTTLFWGGGALAALVDGLWGRLASPPIRALVLALFGGGVVGRTLLWGLDAGLNAVLSVGIPYVLTFYILLGVLEDTGYLNAAAVLLDRLMRGLGLSGRAALPLVAGAGCNVPAIIGLRGLRTERERLIAGTLITMIPCSARTAVIFGAVAYYLGWPWALALYGIVTAVVLTAGWGLNRLIPGRIPDLLAEVFPFRLPTARTVLRKTWVRVRDFVFVAVPIVLWGSVALGALYETGLIRLAAWPLAPLVEGWLGLPTVAGLTLLFAVLRKELALQLLVALAVMEYGRGAQNLRSFMTADQIFTYALVNTIYIPCIATISVLVRALGRRRAALISLGTVTLAVLIGGVAARFLRMV